MADGDNNNSSLNVETESAQIPLLSNNEDHEEESRTKSTLESAVKSGEEQDDKDKGDLLPPPSQNSDTESDQNNKENIEEINVKVEEVKEHDVPEDEIAQANKVEEELSKESDQNDGWIKILGNDSLLIKVIKKGLDSSRPLRGEICTVRLEGRLQSDDTIFESAEQLTFQLGDAEVVPGLDLAVPLMSKGEVSHVKVAARFAYGAKGLPPVVPPYADIFYEIELIDFEIEKDLETLSVAERKEVGIRKREKGNWWYQRDEPSIAIQCYRRAIEFLDDVDGGISFPTENSEDKTAVTEELRQLIEDRLKTYNNMAAAQLKLQAFDAALTSVESVLKCQPDNAKALFRKGKVLSAKGDTEGALTAFKRVSELEHGAKYVLQEIQALQAKRKKEREGEKQLYKRMFKAPADSDDSNSSSSSTKRSFSLAAVIGGIAVAVAGVMAYRYRFL